MSFIINTGTGSGFIDYNDATGSVALIADTWTDIPNNGLGVYSNSDFSPEGVAELMDTSTGYINVTFLELGDSILVRNDFQVNPSANNALLQFRYVLGDGAGSYSLEKTIGRLDSGSGKDYRYALDPDLIYMGDSNTRDNPIKIQIKLSSDGILTNAGTAITLINS